MAIPGAHIGPRSPARRLLGWLGARLDAPRYLDGPSSSAWIRWTLSGAVAGSVVLALVLLVGSGHLRHVGFWNSLGWALAAMFTVPLLVLPFLFSYLAYAVLHRIPGMSCRVGGAAFGAVWHLVAHAWILDGLEIEIWHISSLAPIMVGGLWGSWLPHALGLEFSRPRRLV
jgi:hypothetical protein